MKKKLLSILAATTAVALGAIGLAACGGGGDDKPGKVYVTWQHGINYDVKLMEIDAGAKVSVADAPTVYVRERGEDGKLKPTTTADDTYGWYTDASWTTEFDFDQPITEHTSIFALCKSDLECNLSWAVAGDFAGEGNNWNAAAPNEELQFVKTASPTSMAAPDNVYELTCELEAGKSFKLIGTLDTTSWGWGGNDAVNSKPNYGASGKQNTDDDGAAVTLNLDAMWAGETPAFSGAETSTDADGKIQHKNNIKCLVAGTYKLTLRVNMPNGTRTLSYEVVTAA